MLYFYFTLIRANSDAQSTTSSDSEGKDLKDKDTKETSSQLSEKEIMFIKEVNSNMAEEFEVLITPQTEQEQNIYIENFLSRLFCEKAVTDTAKFMELIVDNNMNASKSFIDKIIIKERKNICIQILNYSNFQDFANILITISLNNDSAKKSYFDLNFAVIYIAERTYYLDKNNNKEYLCMLLSKNELFSSRIFWIELIDLKIKKLMQDFAHKTDSN